MGIEALSGESPARDWIASGQLPRGERARLRRAILTHMGGGTVPNLSAYETVGVHADGSTIAEFTWRGARLTALLREGRDPLDPHPDVWILAIEDQPTRLAEPFYLAPLRARARRAASAVHARLLRLEPVIFDTTHAHHISITGPTGSITFSPDNRMMFHRWLMSWNDCGREGVFVVCRRAEALRDAATGAPYLRTAAALVDHGGHVHYAPKERIARIWDADSLAQFGNSRMLFADGRVLLGALGD